jgi:nucleoside-diphosphate-sugar epimerase
MAETRVFVICGAGFVLSNVVSSLLKNSQVSVKLLLLAEDQRLADRYLDRLLSFMDIPDELRARATAIAGDLREEGLGVGDLSGIDSDIWIAGTLPYRFGSIRQESVISARTMSETLLRTAEQYSSSVEVLRHLLLLSSLRVAGRSSVPLSESLTYESNSFGNFDHCKFTAEMSIRAWTGRQTSVQASTVARIGSLLSTDVRRIGGSALLTAREILGFGRHHGPPSRFCGDPDAVVRLGAAEGMSRAIAELALDHQAEGLRVLNLSDNMSQITAKDFVDVLEEVGAKRSCPVTKDLLVPMRSLGAGRTSEYDLWIRDTFGWFLSADCTRPNPVTEMAELALGKDWLERYRAAGTLQLLRSVMVAATERKFVADVLDLGAVPIY